MKRLLPDPDLEALIRRLNAAAGTTGAPPADSSVESDPQGEPATPVSASRPVSPEPPRFGLPLAVDEASSWLATLLGRARERRASDLFLVAGAPPTIRIESGVEPLDATPLGAPAVAALAAALVPPERRGTLESSGIADFALSSPGGPLRLNVHRERAGWAVAVRLLPSSVADLDALNLPKTIARFAELGQGLVLVTGPPGSGKTTTVAALVRRILERRRVHLLTIEDPVEYVHEHAGSIVEHVEIGRDAPSFARALRSALRQSPDVLVIGEMRDPESIAIAITAADTGRLVLSTLHTGDAPQTVHRILDSYRGDRAALVQAQLSASLGGVVSQQLVPRRDGRGVVPAVEILVATPAVRNLIRTGRVAQLATQIGLEGQAGMLTLERSLAGLVRSGLVDPAVARARSRTPDPLDARAGAADGTLS